MDSSGTSLLKMTPGKNRLTVVMKTYLSMAAPVYVRLVWSEEKNKPLRPPPPTTKQADNFLFGRHCPTAIAPVWNEIRRGSP